jgi:predicted metalloprotease with PDZ domain
MRRVGLSLLYFLTMVTSTNAADQARSAPAAAEPIAYVLRFPEPSTHYVEVEAEVPTGRRVAVDLFMPVWTPGSYLVREYSRNVEAVEAHAGPVRLAVTKTAKNRWRVQTNGASSVTVRYRVYGREMSVRNNFIDADFALLNGAATFLSLVGDTMPRPHDVAIELPANWKTSISSMPSAPGGGANHFLAPDFDTLVDSPIVAGNPAVYEFTVQGTPHVLVNIGEGGIWDGKKTVADVQKVVETVTAFWGTIPYDRYVFFNLITQASGAVEHKAACTMMTSRWAITSRRGYVDWLTTLTHEFFHAWNVKRLRPVELGPFDYEKENVTRMLWAAEGLTEYYGTLLSARANVITRDECLAEFGTSIAELQSTPGRLVTPVEQASADAWIRYYRPDENSPNVSISYYTKGAVIGLLLDIEIRRLTNDTRSLDDVMRLAWQRYSGPRGYTSEELRALVSQVAGRDLSSWLARALDSTEELDYTSLSWLGLRLRTETQPAKPWVGLAIGTTLRNDSGRLVVAQVRRGTPAEKAGVNVEDEILAIGGYRVRPEQWEARLATWKPGDTVPLLVAHREQIRTLDLTFAEEPAGGWKLEPDPGAGPAAQTRLSVWLGPAGTAAPR